MGPIMSFGTALMFAMIERFNVFRLPEGSPFHDLLCRCVDVNVLLFLFNLIPVPPLDGSKMLAALFNLSFTIQQDKTFQMIGLMLFMALVATGATFIEAPKQFFGLLLLGPGYTYNYHDTT